MAGGSRDRPPTQLPTLGGRAAARPLLLAQQPPRLHLASTGLRPPTLHPPLSPTRLRRPAPAPTCCPPLHPGRPALLVGGSEYAGPLDCVAQVYRTQGLAGFMRGWTANYARLGPQTMITFVAAEQLRSLAGLSSL